MSAIRQTFAQIQRWSLPYFRSEDRWAGRALLAAVVAMELANVGIAVLLNTWNARFYNALEQHDAPAFWHQLLVFAVLACAFIVLSVYQLYLSQWLRIRWRQWMTDRFLGAWLEEARPYRMQFQQGAADNPDQRVADDIDRFISAALSLSIGLLGAVITLVSFVAILWGLSAAAPLTLFGRVVAIPGYLLWAALFYAVAGTVIAHWIGRPLIALNFEQQRREADFRTGLLRVRENVEQISLLKGEAAERNRLGSRFAAVRENWIAIMRRQKRLTSFTAGYSQIQVIVPFLAASPAYFARAIELGGLMQTASAFGRVQGALSFFVNAYPQLAEWRAVIERLDGFDQSIASATVEQPKMLVTSPTKDHAICITGLVLSKPDGSALLNVGAIHLAAGETTLVIGPSGGGKSTFLRAVAGIWPHCDGQIAIPAGTRLLILPQRPYLPDGQLRDAITYPLHRNASDDRQISDLLYDVGLGRLAERLADTSHWQIQLSLGEQQRLSIVRAILQEPDWLFLDEATASLDEGSERHVYQLLAQRLPDATIVSVGHRSTLRALHKRTIDLGQIAIESSTRVVLRGRQVQVSVESEIDAGRLGPGQPGSIVSDPDHGQQHGYEASSQRVA